MTATCRRRPRRFAARRPGFGARRPWTTRSWTPRDGLVVIEAGQANDGMVELSVRDHGDGVEAGELSRLIRPFEQGGSTLTRTSEGAGLGLPIVDLMARAMGGALRLKSSPGKGFTATVTLRAG